MVELLDSLAVDMNFTYKISKPRVKVWSDQDDDGKPVGIVGELFDGSYDFSIADLTITEQRAKVDTK